MVFVLLQNLGFAQYQKKLDQLNLRFSKATQDSQKVIILGELANHYYIYHLDSLAAATLHQQLLIAEVSNNENLILTALFGEAITNIGYSASTDDFDKTVDFIHKGINYAEENNLYDFIALGRVRLSAILRMRGDYGRALENAVLALSSLRYVPSDSIKALTYIELGEAYLAKNEAVFACSNFNNAFDMAVQMNSIPLQSRVYHCLAEMYKTLGDDELARESINESMKLNRLKKNGEGLTNDYFQLGRLTDEKYFIDQAIHFSDSLQLPKYGMASKRLLLAYYQVVKKDSKLSLNFLENEPELKQGYINSGIANYYSAKGNCFFYGGAADSAIYYFSMAAPEVIKKSDPNGKQIMYEQLAESYYLQKDMEKAIPYYERSLELAKEIGKLNIVARLLHKLSSIYQQQNNFKNAFFFSAEENEINAKIRKASRDRDLALLDVSRERRKHEQEIREQEREDNYRRNLNYMTITIIIVIVFFVMLVMGSFTISKMMIKMMGYFFFISVFEFIILLIDNLFLSHHLHNEPLKLWLVKIGLIALLVPLQHYLERIVTMLLASKKLFNARVRLFEKKLAIDHKKPVSNDKGFEEESSIM